MRGLGNLGLGFGGGGAGAPWFQDPTQNADGIAPTMWSNFKNNRYMVNGVEKNFSDIWTFTRSSTGTYRALGGLATSSANAARFEVNPVTGEGIGLLMEPASTNTVGQNCLSSLTGMSTWTGMSVGQITVNAAIAPDGTMTAHKWVDGVASGTKRSYRATGSYISGTTYSFSVFAKAAEHSKFCLSAESATFGSVNFVFDLTGNGSVLNVSGFGTGKIEPYGNGWYRCSISKNSVLSYGDGFTICFTNNTNTPLPSYTGTNSGIFLWGMQDEVGPVSTSYIPTTTSPVTRTTESCLSSGAAFSSWYASAQGTQFTNYNFVDVSNTIVASHISNGTSNERWGNRMISTQPNGLVSASSSVQYNDSLVSTSSRNAKHMIAASLNNFRACFNAGLGALDTTGIMPTVDRASIGMNETGAQVLNGTIADYLFYPIRVSDSEMQRLTT